MTPLFPAQRAAEEFDQVLGGTAPPAVADRYRDLLETVTTLQTRPDVAPRADFSADLRERLMVAARTELVATPPVVRQLTLTTNPRSSRRVGTLAASLVILGGSAGMAAAASSAVPGESLYPIKRGVEQASTAVRIGEVSKGQSLLDRSATRLEEVRALQGAGSPDTELVGETVGAFTESARQGAEKLFAAYAESGDASIIETLRAFTRQQMADLTDLVGRSAVTDQLLLDAADVLADIDLQARSLCEACGSSDSLPLPQALAKGAGAAAVSNLLARPVQQVRADAAASREVQAAQADQLAQLRKAVEKAAGSIPQLPGTSSGGQATQQPGQGPRGGPITSTITENGTLIPSITTGAAVTDLVSGVTTALPEITSTVTGGGTVLDSTVDGLSKTLDQTTKGLLP